MSDTAALHHLLRTARRRVRLLRMRSGAVIGALLGLIGSAAVLLVDRFAALGLSLEIMLLPTIAGALIGGLRAWLRPASMQDVAASLDRHFALADRLATAQALTSGSAPHADPLFRELIVRDAQRSARGLAPAQAFPTSFALSDAAVLAGLLLLIAGAIWVPARSPASQTPVARAGQYAQSDDEAAAAVRETAERLRKERERARHDDRETDATEDQALSLLEELAEQLSRPADQSDAPSRDMQRQAAAAALSDVAEQLTEEAQAEADAARRLQEAFQGIDERTMPPRISDLKRLLESGAFGDAADLLDELAREAEARAMESDDLDGLDDADPAELAAALDRMREDLDRSIEESDEALRAERQAIRDALTERGMSEEEIRDLLGPEPEREERASEPEQPDGENAGEREDSERARSGENGEDGEHGDTRDSASDRESRDGGNEDPDSPDGDAPGERGERDGAEQSQPSEDGEQGGADDGESAEDPRGQPTPSERGALDDRLREAVERHRRNEAAQERAREQAKDVAEALKDSSEALCESGDCSGDGDSDKQGAGGDGDGGDQPGEEDESGERSEGSEGSEDGEGSDGRAGSEGDEQAGSSAQEGGEANAGEPGASPAGPPGSAMRRMAERQAQAERARRLADDARRAARALVDREDQQQAGAPPPSAAQDQPADAQPGRDAGRETADLPRRAAVDERPAPFEPDAFDDVDLGRDAEAERLLAEWLDPQRRTVTGDARPGDASGSARLMERGRRSAERAVEEAQVPSRYHELIRRYFSRTPAGSSAPDAAQPSTAEPAARGSAPREGGSAP